MPEPLALQSDGGLQKLLQRLQGVLAGPHPQGERPAGAPGATAKHGVEGLGAPLLAAGEASGGSRAAAAAGAMDPAPRRALFPPFFIDFDSISSRLWVDVESILEGLRARFHAELLQQGGRFFAWHTLRALEVVELVEHEAQDSETDSEEAKTLSDAAQNVREIEEEPRKTDEKPMKVDVFFLIFHDFSCFFHDFS